MKTSEKDSPINSALRQFEASDANLTKLESLWAKIEKLIPSGLQFGSNPVYEENVRSYHDVLSALPKIDGWKPESIPMDLNAIGQSRLDAEEVGEFEIKVSLEEEITSPGRELAEYRHRLNRKRRELIRSVLLDLISGVDKTLRSLNRSIPRKPNPTGAVKSPHWEKLDKQIQEIDALLGGALPRPPRWRYLQRHLGFGMMQDLLDIVRVDWPEVKKSLNQGLYHPDDPIPVDTEDLGTLAAAQPKGQVITKLKWGTLSGEKFERLIFSLIASTPGYENPEWLMQTNAPDRGRDLSVVRVYSDPLSGATRYRVLIQCRHWQTKSVSASDVAVLRTQISLWEPPKVDAMIIATSGRFTGDAVAAIERNNSGDRALKIEMWPESHLEKLLAVRSDLIGEFELR